MCISFLSFIARLCNTYLGSYWRDQKLWSNHLQVSTVQPCMERKNFKNLREIWHRQLDFLAALGARPYGWTNDCCIVLGFGSGMTTHLEANGSCCFTVEHMPLHKVKWVKWHMKNALTVIEKVCFSCSRQIVNENSSIFPVNVPLVKSACLYGGWSSHQKTWHFFHNLSY